jgi:putative OPT family oligopeptide transporter
MNKDFRPFIRAEQTIPEMTVVAAGLGILLAMVMCAANAYLGLYAGMTVSASIPAAVISMGILRGVFRRGSILENNIVQTMASAGYTTASGIIFTMPALIIAKVWVDFDYWTVTLVAASGGVLGVLFMIPLRRMLITGDVPELVYPEGLACAEVLKAGEKQGSGGGVGMVLGAVGAGLCFKLLTNCVSIIKGTIEGAARVGGTVLAGGADISPALLAVGYVIGLNVSLLIFIGGALGWLVAIPILAAIRPDPAQPAMEYARTLWLTQVRYIGVGAMVIGGLWSIWSIRKGMLEGVKEIARVFQAKAAKTLPIRTERDMPFGWMLAIFLAAAILVFGLYSSLTRSASCGLASTLIMVTAAFFFVAVSSYICGLVGSSNNPVSGMTICAVLFACGVMLLLGFRGTPAIIATLGVAGVVCCSAATAGDISQDLKTGYLVGGTPRSQQCMMIVGALSAAFIVSPVLSLLNHAYGIATGGPLALEAPQASLFANIVKAMFSTNSGLPWTMVFLGMGLAAALIITDELLKKRRSEFRTYVMPVAVGIYLPWSLSIPILVGGIIHEVVQRRLEPKGPALAQAGTHTGVLFSSGLIAGESLAGILIAIPIVLRQKLPIEIIRSNLLSVILFAGMAAMLYRVSVRVRPAGEIPG